MSKIKLKKKIDWSGTMTSMSKNEEVTYNMTEYFRAVRTANNLKSTKIGIWSISKNIELQTFTIKRIS